MIQIQNNGALKATLIDFNVAKICSVQQTSEGDCIDKNIKKIVTVDEKTAMEDTLLKGELVTVSSEDASGLTCVTIQQANLEDFFLEDEQSLKKVIEQLEVANIVPKTENE